MDISNAIDDYTQPEEYLCVDDAKSCKVRIK